MAAAIRFCREFPIHNSSLARPRTRFVAAPGCPPRLPLFLTAFRVTLLSVVFRVAELYEYAMLPEHMRSPDPTVGPNSITETGALCISSGSKAGRVPKQKRIVEDDITRDVSTSTPRARPGCRLDGQSGSYLTTRSPEIAPCSLSSDCCEGACWSRSASALTADFAGSRALRHPSSSLSSRTRAPQATASTF